MTPGHLVLAGDRQTPFLRTLTFLRIDFTGAVFKMQVRDRKDGGAVRADLATVVTTAEGVKLVYGGTATIAAHIAAGRLTAVPAGFASGDNVALSTVTIRINEATMEAMPFGTEVGDDLELYHDFHVTPSGGTKEVYLEGPYIVRAGVTQ